MQFIKATGLHRKSGVAKRSDLKCTLRLSQSLPRKCSRMNHLLLIKHRILISPVAGQRTCLSNKIRAARSTHPVNWTALDWNNRAHFIGLAADIMRRPLVHFARGRNAEQRGGGLQRVEMQEELAISREKLEMENPRQARVVELRYFGGLSVEQIGALLEIAPRSANGTGRWRESGFRESRPEEKFFFRNGGPFLGAVPP